MQATCEAPARALPAVELRAGLAAPEVHTRLDQGVRMQDAGHRILAWYLTEMQDRGLNQVTGHASAAHYAHDRLDLAPRRTRELIAVGRKLRELPEIDRAFCEQRISWARVQLLTKVATPEHESAWLQQALTSTCRELALEVRLARAGDPPRGAGDRKGLPEVRFQVNASVNAVTHQKLELAQQKLSAERGKPVDLAECLDVLAELFLNLEEDGSVPGRTHVPASLYRIVLQEGVDGDEALHVAAEEGPLPVDGNETDSVEARTRSACLRCDAEVVGTQTATQPGVKTPGAKTRDVKTCDVKTPAALRQRVMVRDGQRCRCCGARHRLMVHHIRYRSDGGATRAWNLITLCVSCHARVHADLLVLDGVRAEAVTFRTASGERLAEPGRRVEAAALISLQTPDPLPLRVSGAADVRRPPLTLDDIPDRVSARWWREHAHRFEAVGTSEPRFRLKTGSPTPSVGAPPIAPRRGARE